MSKFAQSRSGLAILAGFASLTISGLVVAAEAGEHPAAQQVPQAMGPVHRQAMAGMMRQMQQCMSEEGNTGETGREAIRARMSQRMHKCAEEMMPAGMPHHQEGKEDEGTEGKPEAGEQHHAAPGGEAAPKSDAGH
ncbi:hypothetical protein [Novosphingobium cyanobacteriorum]|uniref:Secreted protein n=1 Tax=Novosphingobium cyanobacteriorum TaxID=3024215 RepID=A0ABT6CNJ5_9SPHN|nr:hypothetical protein [Novosphingobium cyanobacteriorum]MDF8335470.1 hypothetical protein [Novosphingobium cyanobacteriorum]